LANLESGKTGANYVGSRFEILAYDMETNPQARKLIQKFP